MYANIMIPTDGSPLAEKAVDDGIKLAAALGAAVTILTVIEPFDMMRHYATADASKLDETYRAYERDAAAHAARVVEAAAARAAAAGVEAQAMKVESRNPYDAIITAAEERGADLIVMASHGRRGMAAVLVGSETMKVLTYSKIPVLVLR